MRRGSDCGAIRGRSGRPRLAAASTSGHARGRPTPRLSQQAEMGHGRRPHHPAVVRRWPGSRCQPPCPEWGARPFDDPRCGGASRRSWRFGKNQRRRRSSCQPHSTLSVRPSIAICVSVKSPFGVDGRKLRPSFGPSSVSACLRFSRFPFWSAAIVPSLGPLGLEPERSPDPADRRLAHTHPPRHRAGRPVGRVGRLLLQGLGDHRLHPLVADRPWGARPRFVEQPVRAAFGRRTEDLGADTNYDAVRVENPFGAPSDVEPEAGSSEDGGLATR